MSTGLTRYSCALCYGTKTRSITIFTRILALKTRFEGSTVIGHNVRSGLIISKDPLTQKLAKPFYLPREVKLNKGISIIVRPFKVLVAGRAYM